MTWWGNTAVEYIIISEQQTFKVAHRFWSGEDWEDGLHIEIILFGIYNVNRTSNCNDAAKLASLSTPYTKLNGGR